MQTQLQIRELATYMAYGMKTKLRLAKELGVSKRSLYRWAAAEKASK